MYFYHPDHLGSSSYITDANGEVSQHLEYFAFGETFVEEHSNKDATPYLYNAKELDEETGLYYYGARYYDPVSSVWISVDPPMLDGRYLDGQINSGVFNPSNQAVYGYTYQNPINLIDPNGESASGEVASEKKAIPPAIPVAVAAGLLMVSEVAIAPTGNESDGKIIGEAKQSSRNELLAALALGPIVDKVVKAAAPLLKSLNLGSKTKAVNAGLDAAKRGNWVDDAGNIKWPANDGFAGAPNKVTLQPGTRIDRYGYEGGTFVSPEGVPYSARSLAPGTASKPYNIYEVVKPVDGLGGKAAPWFDEVGGGTQYKLNQSIQKLLDGGYIKKVN